LEKQEFLTRLGKHIAQLRVSKQLTQADVAYMCDKDMQSVSRLERGKINPSIYFLQEIATAFEINLAQLLDF
jgi:putative transcriptional regulator